MERETILIQTLKKEDTIETVIDWKGVKVQSFDSSGLDGITVLNHIVAILPETIAVIAGVVIQKIRSKKHVKIIDKGVEIHGVSENNVNEILKSIYENRKRT